MTLAGTRPPLISETNLYELHHRARLAIKPGITGMITNIILNYILVQLYGVYGIVTATIIPLVLINFIFGGQILFKYYFTEFSILVPSKKSASTY